jgi:hypothetical protein
MVDLTRRKTVIGLGLLATGSGATFTQAAFASQVSPASDMRVVVGQQLGNNLFVEAGDIFRNGGANGGFNPGLGSSTAAVENLADTSFFTQSTGDPNTDALDGISVDDLPAAGANNKTNGDLELAVATKIGEDETIGAPEPLDSDNGFIQVVNNTPDDHNIAIRFDEFGEDVGSGGSKVSKEQVFDTYKFKSARTDDLISPNVISGGEQNVPNALTIDSGTTEQIYLEVDTEVHSDAILSATGVEDSPFTTEQDTVDLVDSISVGTTAESINS